MASVQNDLIVHNEKMMSLGKVQAIFLFLYYLSLIVFVFIYYMFNFNYDPTAKKQSAVGFCVLLAICGSSIFYTRKLYKACINNRYDFAGGQYFQSLGTFAFFVFRPVFAILFAWITHMIWEATIINSVSNFSSFSAVHIYMSGVLGFFVGFFSGRVVSRMESTGERHLLGVW